MEAGDRARVRGTHTTGTISRVLETGHGPYAIFKPDPAVSPYPEALSIALTVRKLELL